MNVNVHFVKQPGHRLGADNEFVQAKAGSKIKCTKCALGHVGGCSEQVGDGQDPLDRPEEAPPRAGRIVRLDERPRGVLGDPGDVALAGDVGDAPGVLGREVGGEGSRTCAASCGLCTMNTISVSRAIERGSRLNDPMATVLRSNTVAFPCSARRALEAGRAMYSAREAA